MTDQTQTANTISLILEIPRGKDVFTIISRLRRAIDGTGFTLTLIESDKPIWLNRQDKLVVS